MRRLLPLAVVAALASGRTQTAPPPAPRASDTERVGRHGENRTVLPVNQVVTPAGIQVDFGPAPAGPGPLAGRPGTGHRGQDGRAGRRRPRDRHRPPRVPLPKTREQRAPSENVLQPDKEGQLSYTGLRFSTDGKHVYLSDVNGSVVVFDVAADAALRVARSLRLPDANAPRRSRRSPRAWRCRATASGSTSAAISRTGSSSSTGERPRAAVVRRRRRPVRRRARRRQGVRVELGRATATARRARRTRGRGTTVRVDPVRHVASEGSVSVIDLSATAARARSRS